MVKDKKTQRLKLTIKKTGKNICKRFDPTTIINELTLKFHFLPLKYLSFCAIIKMKKRQL